MDIEWSLCTTDFGRAGNVIYCYSSGRWSDDSWQSTGLISAIVFLTIRTFVLIVSVLFLTKFGVAGPPETTGTTVCSIWVEDLCFLLHCGRSVSGPARPVALPSRFRIYRGRVA